MHRTTWATLSLCVILSVASSSCSIPYPELENIKSPPWGNTTPSWSPDGTQIAYLDFEEDSKAPDGGYWQIYLMNADGSNIQQLTHDLAHHSQPMWSPDGYKLAFSTDFTSYSEIYVMDARRLSQKQVTQCHDMHLSCWNPVWSPDGQRIAVDSRDTSEVVSKGGVYITDVDKAALFQSIDRQNVLDDCDNPTWSPDGRRIAMVCNTGEEKQIGIFVVDLDNYKLVRLTPEVGGGLTWSPDGKRLAFYGDGIWVIDLDTTHVLSLTQPIDNSTSDYFPAWSPDVTKIAFVRGYRIYSIQVDGSDLRQITDMNGRYPAWSPDGSKIAFDSDCGGISLINMDGSGFTPLLAAAFTGTPLTGTAPLTVTFSARWAGAVSYQWDFGDGVTSTLRNVSHVYPTAGTYTIGLTTEHYSCGKHTEVYSNYIAVLHP
ncbi:MAG TPA: PKD domain-containing protein [Anaerolineae bacterium]|nr:PKD domain-containing protein [Anaerolineae bacterium]